MILTRGRAILMMESARAMLLASEPLTRDESTWLEVPEYSLVSFDLRGDAPLVSARMIEF